MTTIFSLFLSRYTTKIEFEMAQFTHLHVHTQYSILDGAAAIKPLLKRAKELGMTSLAITDHGVVQAFPEFDGKWSWSSEYPLSRSNSWNA